MRAGELVLGRWRVLALLGRGGMGEVRLVEEVGSGARYALKSLPPGDGLEATLRFQREAEALGRVDRHPHLGRVHAFERAPDGRWHLLLEYLPGGSLAERLARQGALPPGEVRQLGCALAAALAHCHRHGVLHRDLKPHNVLYDDRGQPRLVDLGLARLAGTGALTATGAMIGTPATMAPEQASGDPTAVGPWSDVYGLGATLYWAACGRAPFQGKSPLEVLTRAATERPTPLRELVPGFPPALEGAILRALERDPQARWSSAEAFGAALGGLSAAGAPRRIGPWVAGGAALLALLVVAGRWIAAPGREPGAEPPPASTTEPTAPPVAAPCVEELLEAEDGVGALAALEPRWAAKERGDLAREAAAALLLLPDAAAIERWEARQGEVTDPDAADALRRVCAGLRGAAAAPQEKEREPEPLGQLFAAERALLEPLHPITLYAIEARGSAQKHVAGAVQALWEAGLAARERLRSPTPLAWVRWRLFAATPRLTAMTNGDAVLLHDVHWLARAATGKSPSARAVRLAQAWLELVSARGPAGARLGLPLRVPPGEDWEALPAPGGDLARVLLRLAALRESGPNPAETLARWRALRAAFVAWRGEGLLAALAGAGEPHPDLTCMGLALGDPLRGAAGACLELAWHERASPGETDELVRFVEAADPRQGTLYRAALLLAVGEPDESRKRLKGVELSFDGLRLALAEAALAAGDAKASLLELGGLTPRQDPLMQQSADCVRALALAVEARREGRPEVVAEAGEARVALEQAPAGETVSWLPWRAPAATLRALEAVEAGRWTPGQPDAAGRRFPFPPD